MASGSSEFARLQIPFGALLPFLLVSFGLAWGILALFIFLPDPMAGIFGQLTGQHPLFYLAVWAPAIAAVIIVGHHSGLPGLRRFLSRLSLWRCSLAWYAFLIIGIPLLFYAGALWKGNLFAVSFPFSSLQSLLSALFFSAIKGPVEEFGWRGFALPLLQRKFAPIWAALMLGVVWGLWHLPAFLLSGTQQSAWSFTPFLAGTIAISLIVTPLFNASRGSILLPAVLHFQLMNPIWPDAQPYDSAFVVATAMLVVWFNRKTMFSRKGPVTQVVPRAERTRKPFHPSRAWEIPPI
jgi:membrane protease YdiL (CAAX protease family)